MMPGCSSYEGHVMGACPCGMFHSQTNSFPMICSESDHNPYDSVDEYSDMYSYTPSSSSVDCTLSLGTPSTRLTEDEEKRSNRHERRSVSNMCWNVFQSKQSHSNKSTRPSNSSSSTNDPLLARRCANCDTTSTPLWRNGPRGPKSLCNACGIRYKKEERRASEAAAAAATGSASGGVGESTAMYSHHNGYWYAQSQGHRMPCLPPGMVDDGEGDSENGMPFLPWRLNVTDRPSLVHDFTR